MLEFFRKDEASFGATRTGITAARLIGGLQKEFMEWQAINSVRMVPRWKKVKEGGDGFETELGRRLANKVVMPILCLGRRKRVVLACLVHGRMSGRCENSI